MTLSHKDAIVKRKPYCYNIIQYAINIIDGNTLSNEVQPFSYNLNFLAMNSEHYNLLLIVYTTVCDDA